MDAAGREADVTVNLVNVAGTELGDDPRRRAESGTILFFSMATSFTAAALGAEGLGRATTMLIGNGAHARHGADRAERAPREPAPSGPCSRGAMPPDAAAARARRRHPRRGRAPRSGARAPRPSRAPPRPMTPAELAGAAALPRGDGARAAVARRGARRASPMRAGADRMRGLRRVDRGARRPYGERPTGRCSDLVARPPASVDGHLWVAHNNDLPPEVEPDVIATEWRVPGDPVVFTIGIGPWISVGFNSAGLALTGNEVSPNDNRIGIPRLLQVRDILRRRTLDEAVEAALNPHRASSYNNVLAPPRRRRRERRGLGHRRGADQARAGRHPRPHEPLRQRADAAATRATPSTPPRSDVRYRRALEWLAPGQITAARPAARAPGSHRARRHSLCRHPEHGSQSKTVFWCIADVTEGSVTYGRGNPCDSLTSSAMPSTDAPAPHPPLRRS